METDFLVAEIKVDGLAQTPAQEDTTPTALDLRHSRMGNSGAISLSRCSTLTSLDLRDNLVGDEGARALGRSPSLRYLNLSGNSVLVEGATVLASNTTLVSLDLSYQPPQHGDLSTGDDKAAWIAQNSTLTHLAIGWNSIGAPGAKAFAANSTLLSLDLRHNDIGDKGAMALALNTTLTSLNLSYNKIEQGALTLAVNSSLTVLDLRGNKISAKSEKAVEARLKANIQALRDRRRSFVCSLVVLARDAANPASESYWRRLPPDLRREILRPAFAPLGGWGQLGASASTVLACSSFIFTHIATISLMIAQSVPGEIVERDSQFMLRRRDSLQQWEPP